MRHAWAKLRAWYARIGARIDAWLVMEESGCCPYTAPEQLPPSRYPSIWVCDCGWHGTASQMIEEIYCPTCGRFSQIRLANVDWWPEPEAKR